MIKWINGKEEMGAELGRRAIKKKRKKNGRGSD